MSIQQWLSSSKDCIFENISVIACPIAMTGCHIAMPKCHVAMTGGHSSWLFSIVFDLMPYSIFSKEFKWLNYTYTSLTYFYSQFSFTTLHIAYNVSLLTGFKKPPWIFKISFINFNKIILIFIRIRFSKTAPFTLFLNFLLWKNHELSTSNNWIN